MFGCGDTLSENMGENMLGVDEECKEAVDDAVKIPFSLFQVRRASRNTFKNRACWVKD